MLVCSLVIVRLHVNVSLFVYKLESECAFMYFKELFFQKKKKKWEGWKEQSPDKIFLRSCRRVFAFFKKPMVYLFLT